SSKSEAGGEDEIRTHETLLRSTPLAGERLRPLGHLSASVSDTGSGHDLQGFSPLRCKILSYGVEQSNRAIARCRGHKWHQVGTAQANLRKSIGAFRSIALFTRGIGYFKPVAQLNRTTRSSLPT